jgi:hypothetical protein
MSSRRSVNSLSDRIAHRAAIATREDPHKHDSRRDYAEDEKSSKNQNENRGV